MFVVWEAVLLVLQQEQVVMPPLICPQQQAQSNNNARTQQQQQKKQKRSQQVHPSPPTTLEYLLQVSTAIPIPRDWVQAAGHPPHEKCFEQHHAGNELAVALVT